MLKPFFAKIYAGITSRKVYAWANKPIETQERTFHNLVSQAKGTIFGKDYNFESIKTYEDFKNNVPIGIRGGKEHYATVIHFLVNAPKKFNFPRNLKIIKIRGSRNGLAHSQKLTSIQKLNCRRIKQ